MPLPLEDKENEILGFLRSMGISEPRLVRPKEEFGDLAVPLHQVSAMGLNPIEVAKEVASKMEIDGVKASAAGPYVNFRFEPRFLEERLRKEVFGKGEKFGSFPKRGIRVLLEHTSANPTGRLHVGRARNTLIGDSLRRILEFYGFDVVTEYYVNDLGRQAATLIWGLLKRGVREVLPIEEYTRIYVEASSSGPSEDEIRNIIKKYEEGDDFLKGFVRKHIGSIMDALLSELESFDIRFDSVFWESDLAWKGETGSVLERLKSMGLLGSEEGALYFEHGGEKIFLTRSDGSTLYILKDVAYHINKASRADRLVDVLGEDHKLEAEVVGRLLEILGFPRPEVVFHSFVTTPQGKLSTRRGRVVYLGDLMEEAEARARSEMEKRGIEEEGAARAVGQGAVKFNILKVQPLKPMTFRWEDALNFEGNSAPYVQYAHARASSILRKAGGVPEWEVGHLREEEERKLMLTLLEFPKAVKTAAELLQPNVVADYAIRVADKFNAFYQKHRVLQADEPVRSSRINLVWATKIVIKNALYLLGIRAPEKM